jgi:hypothetical protein
MKGKQRLSASVDEEALAAAQRAVDEGRAANLSAWVNDAMHRQADHDRRMRSLDDFLSAYEGEHGLITEEEIHSASRRARESATVVRTRAKAAPAVPQRSPRRRTE